VRAGILTAVPVYRTGDTVILSGLVFDGAQPAIGITAIVRIVEAADPTAAAKEVKLEDAGRFDAAPGDGIYTGAYTAAKTGDFTAVLRVTGVSAAGAPYQRTATTTFRVQPPTARITSWKDAGVDADGDGIIESVELSARLTAAVSGDYQAGVALLSAADERIFSSSTLSLKEGDNDVTFAFSALELAKLGQDGPYFVRDFTVVFLGAPGAPLADARPDGGSTAPYTIGRRVQGLQPSLNNLDFGNVAPGSSKELTVAVKNSSSVSLRVGALPLEGAAFSVVNTPTPLALDTGQQPAITVRFAPAAAGTFSGKLTVAGVTIPLNGSASNAPAPSPVVAVTPGSLDFGPVTVGQTKDLQLTVSNRGNAGLTVSSISSSNPVFSVSSAAAFSVAAGATQTITARFAPTTAGAQSGTFTIASNDTAKPTLSVSLSGTGTSSGPAPAPAIDVTPTTLDFASVATGQTKELTVTVRNTGTAALTVNAITSSNPRFSLAIPATPFNVGAGSSQAVAVRFAPNAAGSQTGTLTLASNDPAKPALTVNLSGSAPGPTGGGTTTLSVDDGSFEQITGITGGAPAVYFVNRLTPPSYPATLKNVQIMFLNAANTLKPGDTIRILIGTNPSSSANLNNVRLLAATTSVAAVSQFNSFDTPATTIQSGDFVVGFTSANAAGVFPGALDTTPPNRQRSYVGLDGVNFQLLDTGNLGIRAVIDLGPTGSSAVINPAGESLMFEPLQRAQQ